MIKKLSFLICFCLIFTATFGGFTATAKLDDVEVDVGTLHEEFSKKTYTMADMEGKYKVQGRTTVINNILMTDYSASGMEFEAECVGDVSVTFNATKLTSGDEGGCYFTVIVDGVQKARDFCHITATGDVTVKIAEGLAVGKHTFEIYRQTEIERSTIGIKSITLAGELLAAPENNDLYIEIIGDSAVTAYGNLATNGDTSVVHPEYPKYQDVTQGYAYLAARALKADWSIVAQQGRGAKYGYTTENLQDIYPKLRYNKDKTTDYDFAREPDYVVAALGTNDLRTYNKTKYGYDVNNTLDDVKNGYKEMLTLLREKNPNSKIVWAYITYEPELEVLVKEVIEEAGGEEKGYYSVKLTADKLGGNSHPSYISHQTMATELADFIKGIEAPAYTPGNINGDDDVNLQDVVALAQVAAGWEGVTHVEAALDVNSDAKVDLNDVVLLAQYVAGWDVELGVQLDYNSGVAGVANKTLGTYTSSGGYKMPYTMFVPKNYDPAKEYPVLLFFHGANAKGNTNSNTAVHLTPFYDYNAKLMSQAIVIAPQCPQHDDTDWGKYAGWWRYNVDGNGTLNVAMELLQEVVLEKYNCDENRFYVMGVSMGGEATWKTLEKYGNKIAAAVPMCGSRIGNTSFEDATKFKDVPIWIYHGTNDNTIPFSDSQTRYDNLIAAGAQNVTFTVLEGWDHNVQDYARSDTAMLEWMFSQKLK